MRLWGSIGFATMACQTCHEQARSGVEFNELAWSPFVCTRCIAEAITQQAQIWVDGSFVKGGAHNANG